PRPLHGHGLIPLRPELGRTAGHDRRSLDRRDLLGLRQAQVKRLTNSSALSATSRQPLSITSACPRFGISAISVTPLLRSCRLNDAFAIAHGTVLSFSPEMISSGPRSGFS